jgi:hypothetical protein
VRTWTATFTKYTEAEMQALRTDLEEFLLHHLHPYWYEWSLRTEQDTDFHTGGHKLTLDYSGRPEEQLPSLFGYPIKDQLWDQDLATFFHAFICGWKAANKRYCTTEEQQS